MPLTIELGDAQHRLLTSAKPTAVLQGGGGCGKTFVEAVTVAALAETYPGSRGAFLAPNYPQLRQAFSPHFTALLTQSGLHERVTWHKADNVITWPNGSAVFLRSVQDPEMILGLDLAWAVADELGLWKARAWDYLQNRLRQPGYPHIIRGGYTPKGAAHWTAERLVPSDETEVIRSSMMDNPSVTPDVIDRVRREYGEGSDLWRQEVLGEFVAWQGLVYAFDQEIHVANPTRDTLFTSVHAGVDWGWENPGAIVVVGIDEYDCAWVIRELVESHQPVSEFWAREALDLQRRYNVVSWECDPSAPENIDLFRRAGVRATQANNRVLPGIQSVAARFSSDRIRISPECPHLIGELRSYTWRQRSDGTTVADEPVKANDHAVDALRYAIMALATPRALVAWRTRSERRRRPTDEPERADTHGAGA